MSSTTGKDVSKASPRRCQHACGYNSDCHRGNPVHSCSMMNQMMLDRLAVFDHLIADAAGWSQCHTDSDRCCNPGDLFHRRVVMMMVIDARVPRVVMTMRRGQRFWH